MPSTCFAGRVVFAGPHLDPELNWDRPCPIPPECMVPTQPPMYFCCQHYDAVMNHLYATFDRMGFVDHRILAGPPDEFDRMIERLRQDQ